MSQSRLATAWPRWLCLYLLAACWQGFEPKPARAQMNMAMETADQIPPDKLPVPKKLMGIGNVHLQVTTVPEAQGWFDQGLNLLDDFWDYESARAFAQAVRVDPKCAMCFWGLYKAESFYHSTAPGYADQALAQAVNLKRHATKHERLYIEASAAHAQALKGVAGQLDFSRSLQLWRRLVRQYPNDTQARIFLAVELQDGFDANGEPRAGQKEGLGILENVLKDEPENSAAHHYYIHALEPSAHPEQAQKSAEVLARLAPASGHMVHMPGHIFFRMGDYARAEQAFAASLQVDESYMKQQGVAPDYDWNYVHNLMYAIANLMEEGKLQQATALSERVRAGHGKLESTLYIYQPRDAISRIDPGMPVALRTADWARVVDLTNAYQPAASHPHLRFLAQRLADFAAGMRAVESHDLAKAEDLSARLDADLWRMSDRLQESSGTPDRTAKSAAPKLQVMPDALLEPILKTMSIMSLELRASLLASRKQAAEAQRLFAQAAQKEKALGYREPPAYIRPVGESEGAAFMAVGDWSNARAAYQRALRERPRSGFSLYGMALSSENAGDQAAAAQAYRDFLAVWNGADANLVQIGHARAYLAEHVRSE